MYRFEPIFKTTIWGGNRILPFKGLEADAQSIGESWELSSVTNNESRVACGPDCGMTLKDLLARDGAALLGKENYIRFGDEFPLLVKFIDARQDLSIQVHPNDALAWKRHRTKGKTEMWYVVDADEGAHLYSGFAKPVTPDEYAASVANHTITDLLAKYAVQAGDCFFLPAGRVHAIGAGTFIAEIQQTSDITYRIYDYDRRDKYGRLRQLHTNEAVDAIDYTVLSDYRTPYIPAKNKAVNLIHCPYFTTTLYAIDQPTSLTSSSCDYFMILIGLKGRGTIRTSDEIVTFIAGDTILVPAETDSVIVDGNITFLEVHIE